MSCPTTTTILDTECICNSLTTINSNFSALKVAACDNFSFIANLNQSIQTLNNFIVNLSGATVLGAAKAFVSFSGTLDDTNVLSTAAKNRYIYSQYNVFSVFRKQTGDYRINFTTRFPSRNYVVIGTNSVALVGGETAWLQPYDYRTNFVDIKVTTSSGVLADPQNVSVVIF